MRAMTADEVRERIARAAKAQKQWAKSSFETRRTLLRVIQRFILEEQDTICRVSAAIAASRSSTPLGEVLVTLEKIRWLCNEGEQWLKPEHRSSGAMMFYKKARVEYHPVGAWAPSSVELSVHNVSIRWWLTCSRVTPSSSR